MRNFLIFLGIIAVGYLAVIDTLDRFEELEKITTTSPSKIEMKLNTDRPTSNNKEIDSKCRTSSHRNCHQ